MTLSTLERYLAMEAIVLWLDDAGYTNTADVIRDLMDPVWGQLTPDERGAVNARREIVPNWGNCKLPDCKLLWAQLLTHPR